MSKHITKETKEAVVNRYLSRPITLDVLSDEFNICQPSISKILDEYRVKRYTKVQLFSPDLDEHYFDEIDTEAKAYLLGMLITDGCVYSSKKRQPLVSLALQDSDRYILDLFKSEVKSNKNVTSDGRGCSELSILSMGLVDGLRKYGLTERKSLSTVLPSNIRGDLYPHLIRGIFDGDGSVYFYARPNRNVHVKAIRFCQGNEKFLEDIVSNLYDRCGAERINTYKEKESLWSIAYRKNDSIVKVINYMYSDATVFITRKKKICDLVIQEIQKYGNTEITTAGKIA